MVGIFNISRNNSANWDVRGISEVSIEYELDMFGISDVDGIPITTFLQ